MSLLPPAMRADDIPLRLGALVRPVEPKPVAKPAPESDWSRATRSDMPVAGVAAQARTTGIPSDTTRGQMDRAAAKAVSLAQDDLRKRYEAILYSGAADKARDVIAEYVAKSKALAGLRKHYDQLAEAQLKAERTRRDGARTRAKINRPVEPHLTPTPDWDELFD